MNELALFAGAGIMKPHKEASWKPSNAASVVVNCHSLLFISAQAQNRITRPARFANGQWPKTGTKAIRKRQQQKCVSGGNKMLMLSSNTAPTIGISIIGKSLFVSMALSRNGLMINYRGKKIHVCAANGNFSGAISKLLRMSIIATTHKRCEAFSATGAIQFLGFAKTTLSC